MHVFVYVGCMYSVLSTFCVLSALIACSICPASERAVCMLALHTYICSFCGQVSPVYAVLFAVGCCIHFCIPLVGNAVVKMLDCSHFENKTSGL